MKKIAIVILALACAAAAQSPGEALHLLFDQDWAGIQPPPGAWPDMSLDGLIAREAHDRATLDSLRNMERSRLRSDDRILYDLFERELQIRMERFRVGLHYTPMWTDARLSGGGFSLAAIQSRLQQPGSLQRLEALPTYLDQLEWLLRRGMEAGFLPPRQFAKEVLSTDSLIDADFSLYYRRGSNEQNRARLLMTQLVTPVLEHFARFVNDEYLPKCPEAAGIADWPGGRDVYALLLRQNLGIDVAPEILHEMGLEEVARLREEIADLLPSVGFNGPLDDFLKEVYANPAFYLEDQEQLLAAYRDAYERILQQIGKVTRRAPLLPVRLESMRDPLRAATYSVGGYVRVDISDLTLRPRFEVLSIMMHEGPPGHHLQVGHLWGNGSTPEVLRLCQNSAYTEGWGLFAETLGYDMGLFDDPYEQYGQLSQDLLRAVRVVIDTGVHGLGWSTEQAVQYVIDQTGRPRAFAEAEVMRLRSPATQPAYKVGERLFHRLRLRAEAELGPDFDLARFNDTVLGWGMLPPEVLEKRFDDCLLEACFNALTQ